MAEYTASFLAEKAGGTVKGDPDRRITGINSLRLASENDVSFLATPKYEKMMGESKASIVLVDEKCTAEPDEKRTLIVCKDPDRSFSRICALFAPEPIRFEPGIHPRAVVDPAATVDPAASVGPCAVIEAGAKIGAGTRIGAGCYVGHNSTIGNNCLLDANVTIMHGCIIGNKVILHGGVVIGGDGFGYEPSLRGLVKIPQNGIVQIDDEVEIGANSTVDRARFGKTWIRKGVKIDNLVMVAHNVIVGQASVIIAQTGVAGSTEIGRGVILSAQVGVAGHLTLHDGCRATATAGVTKDIPMGETVYGAPAEPLKEVITRLAVPKNLEKLKKRVAELETQLAELKGTLAK